MNIFRNITGMQPNNPAAAPSNNIPPDPNTNNTIPNNKTPQSDGSNPAIPKAGEGDKSPLAEYSKLWEAKETSPKSFVPEINIDPAKISESASKVDFTKAINPELIAKASSGDMNAMMQVINQSAQAALAQSIGATAEITKQALQQQAKKFNEEFAPEMLRRNAISQNLQDNNPIFDNPAIKPVLKNIENQMATAYPQASPQEVTAKAKEYYISLAKEIINSTGDTVISRSDANKDSRGFKKTPEEDWGNFFGVTN